METNPNNKIQGRAWAMAFVAWLVIMFCQILTFSFGMILPEIMEEFKFGYDTAGLLAGNTEFVAAAITIPITVLAAKLNPKYVVTVVIVCMGISMFVFGSGMNVPTLFASMVVYKTAISVILSTLVIVKIKWFPKERMAEVNGIENFLGPVGQTIATMGIIYLMAFFGGWRNTYYVIGALVLIAAVAWILIYRDKKTEVEDVQSVGNEEVNEEPKVNAFVQVIKQKYIWLLAIAWPSTTLVWIAMFVFWPSYATANLGLTLGQAGVVLGFIPIFSAIASLTSPILTRKLGYEKPMIWSWGFILPIGYFLMLQSSNMVILCLIAALVGYGAYAYVPIAYTILYKIPGLHPRAVSIANSMILTGITLGASLGSLLVGLLSRSMSLYHALVICCLAPIIFGILTLFLPEYGRKSMEKQAITNELKTYA